MSGWRDDLDGPPPETGPGSLRPPVRYGDGQLKAWGVVLWLASAAVSGAAVAAVWRWLS